MISLKLLEKFYESVKKMIEGHQSLKENYALLSRELRREKQLGEAAKVRLSAEEETGKTFLLPKELAKRWRTTQGYLANRRSDNEGVAYHKVYGRVLYDLEDVVAYEKKRKVEME